MRTLSTLLLLLFAASVFATTPIAAEEYYVCATNGKGKKATKDKPAKDLGNIVSKLQAGDVIHIAAGTYTGRGDSGCCVINVPVQIIGGYNPTFTERDPWGQYQTIFSGVNKSQNWKSDPALYIDLMKYRERETHDIVVDGIIFDHADRNRYADEAQEKLLRTANPKAGENPSPEIGGLVINASKVMSDATWNITVQNCIVMNTAPTQGAMSVSGHAGSRITIRNNLVINNTGTGIMVRSNYQGTDTTKLPHFDIMDNTVMFTWKHDPMAQSFSGNSLKVTDNTTVTAKNNVFGFADKYGVHNEAKASVLLVNNLIVGNIISDYLEFDTKINLDDIEDEAEFIHEDSEGNIADAIQVAVPEQWATGYSSRVMIDRNALEADIQAQKTTVNEIRSILGLALQAGTVDGPEVDVWLNRLQIESAISAGTEKYLGRYGCQKPE